MLIGGHANTQLCSRHKGKFGPYIRNNLGVSQCIPISAQLFIIYDDRVMEQYNENPSIIDYRVLRNTFVAIMLEIID